ncbi:DNA polymerase III subunit delta' [Algirhabdus cladophorae]|uniref:DNA polymerase III subunit delta' n=1 Tax=Algirhabdus cladophorae TaxID=3377108 RepID=UPI003B84A7B1
MCAKAALDEMDIPQPDKLDGVPHPRDTRRLFGQAPAEAAFVEALNSDRLHHAWLIRGPRGIGKATLSWRIARTLLTTNPVDAGDMFGDPAPIASLDVDPDHPVARRMAAGSEPRLALVRIPFDLKTEKLRTEITVDEIRKLKTAFTFAATDGGRRVVIIDSADQMNVAAANALLKLLEEPPENTTLLLVTHQPSRLLPTIRSRCRELRCTPLSPDDLGAALAQTGAELTAPADQLAALATGSVGDSLRYDQGGGLTIYTALISLWGQSNTADRPATLRLAEACAGPANKDRFDLTLTMLGLLMARMAKAGVTGAAGPEACPNEAHILARLCPTPKAAQSYATLQQDLSARAAHARAVNLDPVALILDMVLKIDQTVAQQAKRVP